VANYTDDTWVHSATKSIALENYGAFARGPQESEASNQMREIENGTYKSGTYLLLAA
jgi:hypothetical protein